MTFNNRQNGRQIKFICFSDRLAATGTKNEEDCQSCRIIGTASLFAIGCYIIYSTRPYRFSHYTHQSLDFLIFRRSQNSNQPQNKMSDISIIIVMGVSGCGKSTVGQALADELGWLFKDGDSFHPKENIEKMTNGIPLTDVDRIPWLETINSFAQSNPKSVIACSALKSSYRKILSKGNLLTKFVLLQLDRDVLINRVSHRPGHFMSPKLLDSQLNTLEMPNDEEKNQILVVNANSFDVNHVVQQVRDAFCQ
ncbi:unnamed protein product [Caenorhabditis angaria]|uniref:Gluconokinase n=1 Tax=Caenorhabditis angaria TaxID=860376 RepID=A0A9P1N5H3_9PELO|nr:unnamed protein product [Caenorhabditis angaria]